MNKRKILVLTMALSMVAILAAGATLAYFTDTDEATNVFTVGNVKIELDESEYDPETNTLKTDSRVDENTNYIMMPGITLPKDPTITNTGDNDAYVRMTIQVGDYSMSDIMFGMTLGEGTFPVMWLSALTDQSTLGVVAPDGWYVEGGASVGGSLLTLVREEPLKPGEKATVDASLMLPTSIDNDFAAKYFTKPLNVVVTAEAIQADGFASAEAAFEAFEAQAQ